MAKSILDDFKKIKKLDPHHVGESIAKLPDQVRQVLEEARLIKIPREYSRATRIVVAGMGGSSLGAYIIKYALADTLKAPIDIISDYCLPAYVNNNTIVVIASYSGGTEEPLAAMKQAEKKKAMLMAVTAHGDKNPLEIKMIKDNIPGYIFKPNENPSGQPRLGVGYAIFGIMTMLAKAGLFKIVVREIEDIIASMEIWSRELRPEEGIKNNTAKKIAQNLYNKIPVLVSGGFLAGNLHTMRNQINECSKHFAGYLVLPDLNHYSMEGLSFPLTNKNNLIFLFFDSKLYHQRVQKRAELTKQVIKKNKIAVISHALKGTTKLAQAFEVLQLGSWISYYLGMLNGVDPVKIPWVDWFKKELK